MLGLFCGLIVSTATGQAVPAPASVDPRLVLSPVASAPEIVTPTGLAVDRKGRVFVVESHTHFRPEGYQGPKADRIRLIEDKNGDGVPETVSTFFEGSTHTMGLGFHPDGSLYVSTRNSIFRLQDLDGDGRADRAPETIVKLVTPGNYPHNGLSGFAFDAAGHVYFGLGENLGADYKLVPHVGPSLSGGGEGGNVYRCDASGTNLERVATGFWNPFAQTFDAFGRLFIVDNDPDSRPPCRLVHVVPGGDYGYRFRNGRKGLHPFTAWNGELPGTLPMAAGTGEAPAGVLVYESDQFPADYRGAILSTSWGDHRIERFRLKPSGATFKGVAEPIATGGEDFRPVAIATAPDGSVYFSDWVDKSYNLHGKGRVWRLSAKNPPARVVPKDDEAALTHADRPTREEAAWQLLKTAAGRAALSKAAIGHVDPRVRATAVDALWNYRVSRWSIDVGGRPTLEACVADALRASVRDRSEDVRALAIRRVDGSFVGPDIKPSADPSPLVRAEHLRRFGYEGGYAPFLDWAVATFSDTDPFLRQAARYGLSKSVGPDFGAAIVLDRERTPAQRLEALLMVRENGGKAETVLPVALADPDPDVRFVAVAWVAEARLERFRPVLREGLASGAVTRRLFEAYLAALERLDGKAKDSRDEQAGESYVATLLIDPKTPPAVVRRALRMVRPDHPALTLDRLQHFLASGDSGVRVEAVRTLRDTPLPGRFEVLSRLAADDEAPASLRAEAILGLAPAAQNYKPLLLSLAEGNVRSLRHEALRDLRAVPLDRVENDRAAKYGTVDHETAALLALLNGPPAGQKSPADEPLADWRARLDALDNATDRAADPLAGERIFFHPKGPGCYRCHQIDGRGGRAGPDLSTTPAALTRDRLIESIVNPSKEVAPQFVTWQVARKDGTTFLGTLLDESANGDQTYSDAEGRLITVSPEALDTRRPQTVSLMPSDVARLMTIYEFRDLLAYLRGRAEVK